MTKTEEQVIRNVIARLRCEPRAGGHQRESDVIREHLTDPSVRRYLDSWVTAALECLLPEMRDPKLAKNLSE